ncbi:hypothetical protein LCGC14_0512640 [marine sediment metagenome]|uniref:Thiol:disulfide interchange protein n=1 Tax=marine sediment metagenome TaxID=412755 RepID=A0A0F9SJA9_9ZZZZ
MFRYAAVLLALLAFQPAHADEQQLRKTLAKTLPDMKLDSLTSISNTGLYEGIVNGQIIYFTADGRYVLQGDLVSLESRTNLTEQRRVDLRKTALAKLDEKDMVIFSPKNTAYTVTVFTDIDCGYCRKMHSEMEDYLAEGIRIRYLAYPRGGLQSKSYDDAVSVWCAKDRQQAMTDAKQGKEIAKLTCQNPVKQEFELGQKIGVQGTPSIFLESGQMLPGYLPAEKLKKVLEQASGKS